MQVETVPVVPLDDGKEGREENRQVPHDLQPDAQPPETKGGRGGEGGGKGGAEGSKVKEDRVRSKREQMARRHIYGSVVNVYPLSNCCPDRLKPQILVCAHKRAV